VGRVSYENGFDNIGCMILCISAPLPACEATPWEYESIEAGREAGTSPVFIGANVIQV
jgi:hypothetical protein